MSALCLAMLCATFGGAPLEPAPPEQVPAPVQPEGILVPARPDELRLAPGRPPQALHGFGDERLVLVELRFGVRLWGRRLCFDEARVFVMAGGVLRHFALTDVFRVSISGDSLRNGAALGALFGAMVAPFAPCDTCPSPAVMPAMAAAASIAVGILIDARHDARRDIRPAPELACR